MLGTILETEDFIFMVRLMDLIRSNGWGNKRRNRMPKISVIMPLYNAEKYVRYAVESILNQSFKDFELIVIDDCSKDASLEEVLKLKDSRIRIFENRHNQGIAFSRNRGIQNARGQYIALMDDDDIAAVDRLRLGNEYLDMHTEIDVVGGAMNIINPANTVISYNPIYVIHNPKRVRAELVYHDVIPNGSAMMRRDFIQRNGIKYVDDMMGMEDYHFWVQCSVCGNITNIDDVLLYWRDCVSNETNYRKSEYGEKRKQVYKKIQQFALEKNNFNLTRNEMDLFTRIFCERNKYHANTEEIRELYFIINNLICQGFSMEFANEWEYVCKRMYGIGIANADIWSC